MHRVIPAINMEDGPLSNSGGEPLLLTAVRRTLTKERTSAPKHKAQGFVAF